MMRALYSGVSGLKTHQTKMDVIGNNIANVNTVGFKASSTTFSDIMYQNISGASAATENLGGKNAKQIGLGVSTAATKVSITEPGAAQSTGYALDLKLTDSKTTNFFIVNNGSQNLFTRAGSFYLDGNGNLAMASTGYLVQGWQVDPETGDIRKDTVSALRIMQAENMTSAPEYTTNATVSGVMDKNDTNVTSDSGYLRTLTFYDNLGYSYTAKMSYKVVDADAGKYSVELTHLYDSENKDILQEWMEADPTNNTLDKLFGNATQATKTYSAGKDYTVMDDGSLTFTKSDGDPATPDTFYVVPTLTQNAEGVNGFVFTNAGQGGAQEFRSLSDIFGIDAETEGMGDLQLNAKGQLELTYDTTNYTLQFNVGDGSFAYVDSAGNNSVSLNMSLFGDQFSDIDIDFTKCKTADNGGSSTIEMQRGATDGTTGLGKKLGDMIGVSVDETGRIYGSYDNGNTVLLGQIAVAQFANASGLESLGSNCYGTTLNSGDFDGIGVEVSADGGAMSTCQLEMSNVDLSTEFTDMITTQRGFQANSRIITTSDTLLEELVNLKR